MMKQKEAVYTAITKVLNENGVEFHDGMNAAAVMSKEMRATVNVILLAGFQSGQIELDKQMDEKELKSYVSGLQSNWLRKDKRLNGDTKYAPKNPGTRVGASDPQVKALRTLLQTKTDPAERAEIQVFLDNRIAQLKATKAKTVEINIEDLPPELRAKYTS